MLIEYLNTSVGKRCYYTFNEDERVVMDLLGVELVKEQTTHRWWIHHHSDEQYVIDFITAALPDTIVKEYKRGGVNKRL